MYGKYEVYYKGKVFEVYADTPYEAKMKGCVHFGVKGPDCEGLAVVLVEVDGKPVGGPP